MRCVPHAVSSAIITHTDQRRRHNCRAGIMLRGANSPRPWPAIRARGAISMHAVHEPEALKRRAWLSTEAQEALPGLSALADPDTQSPTVAHDDDVFSALTLDERPWEESATAGTPSVKASPSEQDLNAADSETDNVVAQYLGEVRQFALLSFAEEQALAR